MPTGPRVFLSNSGYVWATALRPVPPKKGLVPYMPVKWGVHQIPQINLGLTPLQLPGSASAGRVICGTDLAECVSVPNKGNADGEVGIFGKCRARVGYGPAPGPTIKKGLVPHLPVGWGGQQIPQINLVLHLSRCRVALRPTVLSAARIWPSVSRYLESSFGLRGPSPPDF